jgi:membrane-bound serine protease (ClpP class)
VLARAASSIAASPETGGRPVATLIDIERPIGPATSEYVHPGLAAARAQGARVLVLRLDTPGGLSTSMREIIKRILAAPVPVVAYVAPSGARAASAGTYIRRPWFCHCRST